MAAQQRPTNPTIVVQSAAVSIEKWRGTTGFLVVNLRDVSDYSWHGTRKEANAAYERRCRRNGQIAARELAARMSAK